MNGKKVATVVLAAGQGKRMESKVPKQYMELSGKPIICYALQAFEDSIVDEVVVVTGRDEVGYCREQIIERFGFKKVKCVVPGGEERYHSVYEGLKAAGDCDCVLIHDGARPLVTKEIIERAAAGAFRYKACVVGMPVKDTIKVDSGSGFAASTPDRRFLWQIQTPQAFEYQLVLGAYRELLEKNDSKLRITDDAMVVETVTSQKVKLIPGDYSNIKITTPEDMIIAEALLAERGI